MRRFFILLAALLPLMGALAPVPADARLGGGHSFGSRGAFTYFSPRQTTLAPGAAPFERSQAQMGGYGRPGMGMAGSFNRHPFMSGLLGGFIGAGIFGMLFGGGFMHMGLGFGGFFGVLLQLAILFLIVRWLMRRFLGGGAATNRQPVAPQPSIYAPVGAQTSGCRASADHARRQPSLRAMPRLRSAGLGRGRSQRHRSGGHPRDDGLFP